MNNYLKKLAYIKRELVKLAAPGSPDLEYMEPYVPRPNNVGNMRTMQSPYQGDPNIPVSDGIPVPPQPTPAWQYDLPYNQQLPVSTLPEKSYIPSGQMHSVLEVPNASPHNLLTPQTKAPPRSIVTSATEPHRYKGKNYSGREMQKRIDMFQKEYLRRYAAANGLTEAAALARLNEKGRWYDTSDMTALVSQMNANKRLRNIALGKKTVDNLKWRIKGGGQADGMRGMNYATVQQAMDDLREQKMNRMLQKPRRAAEQSLQNPAAMPGMPANIDNTPQKPVSTPAPGPTEIDSKNLAKAQAMTDDGNYVLGRFRSKVGL